MIYWLFRFALMQSPMHYSDVIISAMVPQITGVSIVFSTVCWGADQRKHQSSGPGTQKMFPFHDVIVALLHLAHSTKNMRLISLTALEALFLLSESCAYESMSSTKYSVSYTMKRSKTCDIWEHTFSRNGNESNFSRITSSKTDWPKLNSAS